MSNPALNARTFENFKISQTIPDDSNGINNMINEALPYNAQAMSYNGTINKSLTLLTVVVLCSLVSYHCNLPIILNTVGVIAAFILGIFICYKPHLAPCLAPLYGICEGVAIGILSKLIDLAYGHVALEAVMCTMAVVFSMLAAYRLGIIKVTATFRTFFTGAIYGVLIYYIFLLFTSLCGVYFVPLYSGPASIIINLIICGIASFSLAMDFEDIKQGVECHAPKYMEWYCAYGLMVTIIWIYIEILKLLAASRRR